MTIHRIAAEGAVLEDLEVARRLGRRLWEESDLQLDFSGVEGVSPGFCAELPPMGEYFVRFVQRCPSAVTTQASCCQPDPGSVTYLYSPPWWVWKTFPAISTCMTM